MRPTLLFLPICLASALLACEPAAPPADESVAAGDGRTLALPAARNFAMGFAYQPYDWNEQAFQETARILADHGDMIGVFFDAAVPWPEAAAGAPYHPNQEEVLARRAAAVAAHHEVLVSASLLGGDRVSLSRYLGESDLPLPAEWAGRSFDHPEVVSAYLYWCRDLIRRFNPDYFVYVMEADAAFVDADDPRFQQLLRAIRQIYPALKKEFPDLPLIVELMLMNDQEMAARADVVQALLPYSDLYGVSTYPFLHAGGDPADIQRDWFSRVRKIAPDKPFAVIETNHLAEDFEHPELGVPIPGRGDHVLIPGSAQWQAGYLELLFTELQLLDAEFVVQWTSRDLDRLAAKWRGTGSAIDPDLEPMAKLANDCGVYDESGQPRPSLSIWEAWRALPRRIR